MSAKHFSGPWLSSGSPVETPGNPELGAPYAGKLMEGDDGHWEYMAFLGDDDGNFLGELTDPYPVEWAPDGTFLVTAASGTDPNVAVAQPEGDGLRGTR